ncbi:MAG: ABC transporter permease [Clostridium sp.]|jgi:ABC-type transport system involved in multi-copper enzyme maturation permease subunit|nr:ABC transporter permease [Clostridium sp.]
MMNFIKLELKRNKLKTYLLAVIGIMAVTFGFLYLYAAIPYIDSETDGAEMFSTYMGVMGLTSIINMAAFCVLSAAVYSRFVIDEYCGKRAILLFSYPVSRRKVFFSKLAVVNLVTVLGLIACNTIAFTVFLGIEAVFPLVEDTVSIDLVRELAIMTLCTSVLAAAIGAIAMSIGFRKKSIPVTFVAAIILASVFSSALGNIGLNAIIGIGIGAVLFGAVIVLARLSNEITQMEA